MRELTLEEIEMVSGGVRGALIGYFVGKALDGLGSFVKSNLEGQVRDDTFSSPNAFVNVYGA